VSVLTDVPSFQDFPDYLRQTREASGLRVQRKDFLFEPYQVYEARFGEADCILVIMASVDDEEAAAPVATAHDLGMDMLVEVHDEAELTRALALETQLILLPTGADPAASVRFAISPALLSRSGPRVACAPRFSAPTALSRSSAGKKLKYPLDPVFMII
jgi:indole-3-glycerol phosphate synthase